MAMPALEALKENLPGSAVHVLAKPWVAPLFVNHPAVDTVIPYRKEGSQPRALLQVLGTALQLRRWRFDLAVLFQNAFEAALLAWLAAIPVRLGYDTDGRRLLLSHPVPRPRAKYGHQVEYYLGILRGVNWRADSRDPRVHLNSNGTCNARSLLLSHGLREEDFLLGLAPGATYGPAKRWPPERFAAVADMAAGKWDAKAVVLGSAGERGIGDEVARAMKGSAVNLCGETGLDEAAAVIGRCRVFLSNDSGLMHLAAALDVPTVAVFGSTDPVATGPRGRKARMVNHPLDCSPCLKPDCADGCRCLRSIEPMEVWRELESLVGGKN